MALPFSHDQFLDVFGSYNTALWPAVALLWVATALAAALWIVRGAISRRALFALLAIHWAWSGLVYHFMYFEAINPAARLFAALFVVEGLILAGARRPSVSVRFQPNARGMMAAAFVFGGLLYPAAGLAFGLHYPRMPLFGVPCPTTLVTAGWLLAATGSSRFAKIVPILWCVAAGSAAITLGIRADLALIAAGAVMTIDLFAPAVFGRLAAA
jgi:hypothetical protein